jgi:hypothetical protein
MSYSIIFETKIVLLKGGRILHLDRSGCNNDGAGRNRDEFTGKIYTREDFIAYAQRFIEDKTNDYSLQIGSKRATYKEYGEHLLRMLKRAKTWEEYSSERTMKATLFTGVHLYKPFEGEISAEEFEKNCYDWMYGEKGLSYRRKTEDFCREEEFIGLVEAKKPVNFYVGKPYAQVNSRWAVGQ